MRSVQSQSLDDFEHLIIDGLSKDDTLEIVRAHPTSNLRIVSESDKGLYDAMNKGIKLARGRVIAFLNSDDFYADKDVLLKVYEAFEKEPLDIVYGDLHYVKKDSPSEITRYWQSGSYRRWKLHFGWHPPHPTFFAKKDLLMELSGFNLSYRISADYDLMIRSLLHRNAKVGYIPSVLVKMREGGVSNQGIRGMTKSNLEVYHSLSNIGIKTAAFAAVVKPLGKIRQFTFFHPFKSSQHKVEV